MKKYELLATDGRARRGRFTTPHGVIEEQKKRGALIIIACHDKEELEMLSDEIIEIYEGRIVAQEKV